MKTIKYILIFAIGILSFSSCLIDQDEIHKANSEGVNVVTFDRPSDNLTGVAETDGPEYNFMKKIRVEGPTVKDLTSDIVVNVEIAEGTTADGTMYRINNNPITLKASENYLGLLDITLTTLGNTPPKDGTPEADAYVAPVLNLKLVPTGDANVIGSGKIGKFQLNFTPPNPFAGDYTAHIIYRHPSVGPYPDNIAVEETNDKTMVGVTANRMELEWFAVWSGYLSWITVNADNSVSYIVSDDWGPEVKMGDPFDASKVSHFDPDTGIIYLYYHYDSSANTYGTTRVFWEVFTPNF